MRKVVFTLIFQSLFFFPVLATVWNVGPTHTYTKPSQVSTLVQNGDTVYIDAGTYSSDVAKWTADNLFISGVGGYAHMESNGNSYGGKAIWVINGDNVVVEWIEFSECTVNDNNGAGIRQQGLNLTVRHCYFHDNENGILTGALHPCKDIIEYCEFGYHGYGDGYSHNLYIGHIDTLIFRYNYSHHAKIGHELKSRAYVNYILFNRFSNEATGNASREIDLPNGGLAIIMGNIIHQGPNGTNSNLVGFGLEGLSNPGPHNLYLVNNTLVNQKHHGLFVDIENGTNLYKSYNNIFAGNGNLTLLNGTANTIDTMGNMFYDTIALANFVNSAFYNFHLSSNSTAIGAGIPAGTTVNGISLTPTLEYLHPSNNSPKNIIGNIDAGAFEYVNQSGVESAAFYNGTQLYISGHKLIIQSHENIVNVKIYGLSGKLILNKGAYSNVQRIDVGMLCAGIYIAKLRTKSGNLITKKFYR